MAGQYLSVINVAQHQISIESFLGLGTEFRSEKIPRNRLGTISVIPRKKVLIPNSAEEPIPKLGTERNGAEFREKIKFYGTD
jgi:hypothetical protein